MEIWASSRFCAVAVHIRGKLVYVHVGTSN